VIYVRSQAKSVKAFNDLKALTKLLKAFNERFDVLLSQNRQRGAGYSTRPTV
jgi:hypothetical protein